MLSTRSISGSQIALNLLDESLRQTGGWRWVHFTAYQVYADAPEKSRHHLIEAGNGRFTFLDLPAGQYTLSVMAPAGFTAVADQTITLNQGGAAQIGLQALGQVTGVVVYEDWDGDGRRSHDEPLVANPVTMTLGAVSGDRYSVIGEQYSVIGNQYSVIGGEEARVLSFGGRFLFWDVPDGTYEVTGWWTAVAATTVTLNANRAGAVALPAVDPGLVRGTVWFDANDDGRRQPWETPLAGISVTLAGVERVTDKNGRFLFAGVAAGTHNLEVLLPEGLMTTVTAVTTTERGTAVGVGAVPDSSGYAIYLPLITKH